MGLDLWGGTLEDSTVTLSTKFRTSAVVFGLGEGTVRRSALSAWAGVDSRHGGTVERSRVTAGGGGIAANPKFPGYLSARLAVGDVVQRLPLSSDVVLMLAAVFDVVDVVMIRGRSDGASRRRAESERPRCARRASASRASVGGRG
jgi:hypothetical protein